MRKKTFTKTLFSLGFLLIFGVSALLFAQQKPVSAETKKVDQANSPIINKSKTDSSKNVFLDSMEQQILDEINAVRQNPSRYADYLEAIRKYYKDKLFTFPERDPVLTIEGTLAIDDAVANLRKAVPSAPLVASELIHRATADHLKDLLSGTKLGHRGSDGTMPDERLAQYMNINALRMGENVVMTWGGAREVILNMLVDDGFPSRAHRRNVLDPEFKFIGLSSGEKSNKGGRISVFIFTTAESSKKAAGNPNKTEEF